VASQTMACERQEVEEALQHCQHKLGAEEASAAEAASSAAAAVARAERLQVALVAAQSTEVAEASEAAVQAAVAERAACVAAGLHRQLLSQESEVSHLEAWLGEEVEVAQAWQDSREELAVELTHCSRHAESFGTRAEELQLALHAQARRADELQGVLGEETRRADELQRALLEASSSSEQLQAFLKKDNSERQQQRQQQEQQQQQQSLALTALRDRHSHEEVGAAQQARETLDKLEASQRSQFEHLHRSCEAALGGLPLEFFQEVRQKSMSLRESEATKSAEREGGISLREGCLVAEQYAAILDAVAGCVSSLLRENTQLQDANRALAPKQHLLVLSVGKNISNNNNKSSVRSTKAAGASGLQPESPGAAAALSDSESLASGSAALRRPGSDSASAEEDSGEKQQQQQHQQQQQQHQQQQQQQKGGDSCGVNFNSNDNHNNNNNSNNGNNNIESISGGSEAGTAVSCHNRGTGGTGGDGPELSRQLWAVRQELAASREENRQVLSARRRVQQDTHVKTESRVSLLVSQCEDAGWQAHRLQSELTDQGRSHQEDVRKLRAEILRLEQQQQQAQHYEEAFPLLCRVLVLAYIGLAAQSLGRTETAMEAYSQAVQQDPLLHVCHANLASLHSYSKDAARRLDPTCVAYVELDIEIHMAACSADCATTGGVFAEPDPAPIVRADSGRRRVVAPVPSACIVALPPISAFLRNLQNESDDSRGGGGNKAASEAADSEEELLL
ncbi:unnamed protein product, partial [Polarella glacialis]